MFLAPNESRPQFNVKNFSAWFLLAFQAGVINMGGFLSCHRFVSHVTGFATHFGAELAKQDYLSAIGILSVPTFFLYGAMTSGFLVDRKRLKGHAPKYTLVFFILGFICAFISLAGSGGYLGEFGAPHDIFKDYLVLALLSFSCGLQNAVITTASGTLVRTTHLTGVTTDLGIGLVRLLSSSTRGENRRHELLANGMRVGTILFFVVGSAISSFLFLRYEYMGFLIPMLISFGLSVYAFTLKK